MNPLFSDWLLKLRQSSLSLGTAPGSGGAENLWTVAIPPENTEIGEDDLLDFLRAAQRIRLLQTIRMGCRPVVFYVWHDEMAGQLRFSVARGTFQDLPFRVPIKHVYDLKMIVRSYLNSEFRGGIPWERMDVVTLDESVAREEAHVVHVWAFGTV